ncbi:MAG: type I-U CRISPR-associated protein Csb2, partial [Gemmataceae bacterium]|nr:type I-U CRISPR-associated protein Csb2 [Gemmataceae bacterium]
MPGLTIGWEYLTGRCVATDPSSRERAEWPPHPGRVYLALAATWFETGEDPAQGEALRWLETLGDPEMWLPPSDRVFRQTVVGVYVPVNDAAGPAASLLQSAPITRSKRPRTFPSVWVGSSACYLHWPQAAEEDVQRHRAALAQLCGEVTRIGHSSSLVRMWVADDVPSSAELESLVPDEGLADLRLRTNQGVSIDRLPDETGIRQINEFARLEAILTAPAADPGGRKMKRQAQEEYERIFGQKWGKRATPPPLRRPRLGLWTGYRRRDPRSSCPVRHTIFDQDVLILSRVSGPHLPLTATVTVTQALRGAILSHLGSNIPEWVSGHLANGEPLRDGRERLAIIPLPSVGHEHADGHLLGVGLVFTRAVPRVERGRVLG